VRLAKGATEFFVPTGHYFNGSATWKLARVRINMEKMWGPGSMTQRPETFVSETSVRVSATSSRSNNYHTYGVLWVPGKMKWYFDNKEVLTAQTYPILDSQDYFLILGMQEGVNGGYGNTQGVTANTMAMNVEWIHVFQVQ
jgi:hypothetical protein